MDFFKLSHVGKPKKAHTLYENIYKGTSIRIIGIPGSMLNSYKGYIGEVRDYKRGQDFAMVTLNAINNGNLIKVPLEHFEIIEDL
jgi:hypothetical protein